MWLLDTIRTWVKKWKDTVVDTTTKVGNYMEEKSATLVDKLPGADAIKTKAATYTEKTVDRIGHETKDMIKEGHEFIDSHMKKHPEAATPADATKTEPVATTIDTPQVAEKVEAKVEVHEDKKVEEEHASSKKAPAHKKK